MQKDKLASIARDWYKPGKQGDRARALLDEHPDLFA